MQRWQLTAGLVALALTGAMLAPRLGAALTATTAPPPDAPAPPLDPEPTALTPVRTPPVKAPVAAPVRQGPLVVTAGLDRTAVLEGHTETRFLTLTVHAPADLGATTRHPVDLAVVMDTSGSMRSRGKIAYAKQAARVLAGEMRAGDRFGLITFSDDAQVVLPPSPVVHVGAVNAAIDRIQPRGPTNLHAGLTRAGHALRADTEPDRIQRVVLLSDGKATVGPTDAASLARAVGGLTRDGVTLSTVGLGLDFDEDRMVRLADLGGGSYDFVDEPGQLHTVFTEELHRSTRVVARKTRLDVRLPPGVEGVELLGWQAERTARGWSLPLGDIHAGETKKIVARVRVTGPAAGSMPIASATARYRDVVAGQDAASSARAQVSVTPDATVAAASWDRKRAAAAQRAWGNVQLDRASRAYAAGRQDEARALANEGASTLQQAAVDFEDDSLAAEAADATALGDVFGSAAPSSEAGRRSIKQAKELSYDRTR